MPGETTETARAISPPPVRVYQIGFWAAFVAAALPVLMLIFYLVFGNMSYGIPVARDATSLLSALVYGEPYLLALAAIVLFACLVRCAPAGRKAWAWIGLALTVLQAGLLVFQRVVATGDPQLYGWWTQTFAAFARVGVFSTLGVLLLGLSNLAILPVFQKEGVERAIRWCLLVSALLVLIGVFIPALSGSPFSPLTLARSAAQNLVFPLAAALMAAMFRQAGRATAAASAKDLNQDSTRIARMNESHE